MAESIVQKGGGGAASDECTAVKTQVLAGCTAVTKDSGDEPAAGTMANRGAVSQALNCGGSYTVPEGYHNGGGKITANSLANQTGGATAEDKYVLNGKTYWKDGVKRTGSMTVASVASFSVAPYSTSQVLATWKNPGRGPYSGVLICAKAGGYPNNAWDGITYQGVGNNSAVNGTSSQIIGGLAAGTTYYFRIWVYCTCSAGDQYSGHLQATCAPTAHGRAAFTASGTWTVPANVRSINVHCTGGGGAGTSKWNSGGDTRSGGGGGGGYTSYKNNISVSPGQVLSFTVCPGSIGYQIDPGFSTVTTSNGVTLVSAHSGFGGSSGAYSTNSYAGGSGGSAGGDGMANVRDSGARGLPGRSDGGGEKGPTSYDEIMHLNGHSWGYGNATGGRGQGLSTREFGTGTLYAGGGGGGGRNNSSTEQAGAGGAGGGGRGGGYLNGIRANPSAGAAGTGGGGGGGAYSSGSIWDVMETGAAGGSGNVIITW